MTNRTAEFTFRGFQSPRYTQVPDELFDELMPFLSGAELKVLLYIVRKTFGWKKDSDNISISQMVNGLARKQDGAPIDRGVGLSKKTLLQALNSLEERRIIITQRRQSRERGWEPTSYRLNVISGLGGETTPTLGEKIHQGVGGEITPSPRSKKYAIQETALQETLEQETRDSLRHSSSESLISNVRNGNREVAETKNDDRSATLRDNIPIQQHAHIEVRTDAAAASLPRGVTTLGAVLTERRSPRPKVPSQARQAIGAYIRDFALEFGDQAPLRSTVTRAVHLYEDSGLSIGDFIASLHAARSVVKEYSGNVKKGKGDTSRGWKPANKVPYFFAVLEDQLGMRPDAGAVEQSVAAADGPRDRGAVLPAAPASHEQPRRDRRTIGGPLVRIVPLGNADEHLQSATVEAPRSISATAQKRPKSSRMPVSTSNLPPNRSAP